MPIIYIQQNAPKIIPTDADIVATNLGGMGNKVGTITNRITAMFDKQVEFEPGSVEWKELQTRIDSGEKFQQDQIDKIKGIIAKPMPDYWYDLGKAKDKDKEVGGDFYARTCTHKKPYFMTYIYKDYHQRYKQYVLQRDTSCINKYGITCEELESLTEKTEDQKEFIDYYNRQLPYSIAASSMNRICWHIEGEFEGVVVNLKHSSEFDYTKLKYDLTADSEVESELKNLMDDYIQQIRIYKNSCQGVGEEDRNLRRENLKITYKALAKEKCNDDKLRLNTILDISYGTNGNKQFCWDCIGDLIVSRLLELKS